MKKTTLIILLSLFITNSNAQSALATSILPNISELQNFAGNDSYVYVKGYYTPDDDGGGLFKNETSNLDENGGTVFNVNGNPNKKWIRINKGGDINVKWFGARGISNQDDTDKIQKAIYAAQYENKSVYLPKGQYRITKSLRIDTSYEINTSGDTIPTVTRRLNIKGEEKTRSVIRGDFEGTIFNLKMPDKNTMSNMVIKNLTLIDDDRTDTNLINGIEIKHNQKALIENIIFRDLRYDILAESFWSSAIKNCVSRLDITNSNFKNRYRFKRQCNDLLIEKCVLSNSTRHDDYLVSILGASSSITFSSCTFEFGRGLLIDNREETPLTNISFTGCYWEWFQFDAIGIHNQANVRGINITNNYFNAITESTTCKNNIVRERYEPNFAIVLGGVKGMTITDSYFVNWWKNPIYNTGFAEGINVNMCTWKTMDKIRIQNSNVCSTNPNIINNPDYPIINSIPSNSIVFNPKSERGNYGDLNMSSFNVESLKVVKSSDDTKLKFLTPPLNGNWDQGDIIYNDNPLPGSYIGWVYINGKWNGFGLIENK
ncbi:glycosyl hydrolase family 28-related protein [Aquimarina sp. 2201CG5-10]|uniref:glycosyl hydrolase family 28-related protein n=1 Tax=Aquimarina callyspongiae TaxID=3098150 RepID=UPI002AB3BC04|nr:glycosyl hydrolase family 28-related protein [Aquimarina sp. 2201CG5-10]MDY8135453.1 glycosyl hydrolase family 28-related protein [Aquimarina sp. 2201CG5-10]